MPACTADDLCPVSCHACLYPPQVLNVASGKSSVFLPSTLLSEEGGAVTVLKDLPETEYRWGGAGGEGGAVTVLKDLPETEYRWEGAGKGKQGLGGQVRGEGWWCHGCALCCPSPPSPPLAFCL